MTESSQVCPKATQAAENRPYRRQAILPSLLPPESPNALQISSPLTHNIRLPILHQPAINYHLPTSTSPLKSRHPTRNLIRLKKTNQPPLPPYPTALNQLLILTLTNLPSP